MIKRLFSFRFKFTARLLLQRFKKCSHFEQAYPRREKRRAYLFLAADYGNLGDVAITYAQTKYLEEFGIFEVVPVFMHQLVEGIEFVRRTIKEDDLITLIGGGNMGDQYVQIEICRQTIIKTFPSNKIISFPQTVHFIDSSKQNRIFRDAIHIYNKHHHLILVAREAYSYKIMQSLFPQCELLLTPDIVLSLATFPVAHNKKGAVLCFRSDHEKQIDKQDEADILKIVKQVYGSFTVYDTHIGQKRMPQEHLQKELETLWEAFSHAEVVITDRLHGMIFSYITNTPCIVFPNNNHKIKGCYKWIEAKGACRLLNGFEISKLPGILSDIKSIRSQSLLSEFDPLKQRIIEI